MHNAHIKANGVRLYRSVDWNLNFFVTCLTAGDKVCLSDVLCILSGLFSLLACLLLICRRCAVKKGNSVNDAAIHVYCFVGNLCSTVGALLSHQITCQMYLPAFMAILDVAQFTSVFCSLCLWLRSKTALKQRMMVRRRRQNLLAVAVLFAMGWGIHLGTDIHHHLLTRHTSPSRRRLLSTFLHDRAELLGYGLGLLSFVINWTSRLPFFFKARRGELGSAVHVSSRVLSSSAGILFAAAIVLYDMQMAFMAKAMPWILSGACCAILDVAIVALSCHGARRRPPSVGTLGSDTESLLGRSGVEAQDWHKWTRSLSLERSKSPKVAEMGRYMDINVQPGRKVCLKEVRIVQQGNQSENQPLKRTVKVVRVDEPCSTYSSSDASSMDSELEWDFEESNPKWSPKRRVPRELTSLEAFPLQEWVVSPAPKTEARPGSHVCRYSRTALVEGLAHEGLPDLAVEGISGPRQ